MTTSAATPNAPSAYALRRPALYLSGLLALLISTGCAVLPTPALMDRATAPAQAIACADWYAALDRHIELAGVRDAGAVRLAGFPHLRVDRFTASLVDGLPTDLSPIAPTATSIAQPSAPYPASPTAALLQRLQQLDLQARSFEIANLPPRALAQLAASSAVAATALALTQRTQDCAQQLRTYTLAHPQSTATLLHSLKVPDDYATGYRLLGAYALTRYPFASGIRQFEAKRSAVFAGAQATHSTRVHLSPPAQLAGATLSPTQIRSLLEPPPQDPLGIPMPTSAQAQQLLAHFAPSFDLAIDSDDDKPGALVWRASPGSPSNASSADDSLEVDTRTPVLYSQMAHTRYGPHSLLQLVYTLWFPARPTEPGKTLDLLAGKLDGITWRVTLAPDGTPLVYDTMHPCGCYHMFFPTPAARAKPAPQPGIEWAFIPQSLPHLTAQQRVVVHVAAGTHYIDRVSVESVGSGSTASADPAPTFVSHSVPGDSASIAAPIALHYAWRSYDSLRSLPTPDAHSAAAASKPTHRSIFGPDGFIAHTDRPERFIFWPMGIARAGAMRQWGKHATAFVGRRHFDDATLLQQRFAFDPVHFKP